MNKILIVLSPPDIDNSTINKRWIGELNRYPELFTVHNIYKQYGKQAIDIQKEQKLIEAHSAIVFQFPLYWFSCPALLTQWFDDVFSYGWAYGEGTNGALKIEKWGLQYQSVAQRKTIPMMEFITIHLMKFYALLKQH